MDQQQRRLAFAIWEHISAGGDQQKSAADAIAALYGLKPEEESGALSTKPHTLSQIFNAGLEKLGVSNSPATTAAASTAKVGFDKFLGSLKKTKFFDGVSEGTPEYEARVAKARAKYDEKYGSPTASKATVTRQAPPEAPPTAVTPADAEVFKGQGNDAMRNEAYAAAMESYSKAIQADPSNAVYYSNRAAAHIYLADYASAVEDCQKAISLDGSFVRPRERLASAYRHLEMHTEEINALEQAIEISPDNAKLKADLAVARSKMQATRSAPPAGATMPPGMPDMSAMMSNPAFGAMASQLQQNGGLEGLMNNPAIAQMASQFMGGGAPGAPGVPGAPGMAPPGTDGAQLPEAYRNVAESMSANPRLANLMEQANRDPMAAMQSALQDPNAMQDIMQAIGPMLGGGGMPGMPPQPPPGQQ